MPAAAISGNHANIGVIAYTQRGFEYLRDVLTAERVEQYFIGLGVSRVERFELPRIWALNFLLYDALAGGASMSLRIDTQGQIAVDGQTCYGDGVARPEDCWTKCCGRVGRRANRLLNVNKSFQ